tara:strand:+ start:159 stop:1247 length:1089 start_codon:yes stop_codon:yes gene_type:complete
MTDDGDIFKNVFLSIIEGALVVSEDGVILGGNLAAEEILGQSRDLLIGKFLEEFFSKPSLALNKTLECAKSGVPFREVECEIFRKPRLESVPVSMTLSPYLDQSGILQGAILLIRDLRMIKDLEENSRQKDQLAMLGRMALGLAHEIKNPLGGIRGSAQILSEDIHSQEQKEFLEVIVKETDRIDRMLSQILNLAGPQKISSKSTNIHKILEEIILLEKKTLASKGGVFISDYDPSLPPVEADEDRLKQVFINLLKNSTEASPKNGDIRVMTRIHKDYATNVSGTGRNMILVEIEDHGPGITENDQKKIFAPFFTTKKKGTGLGLAISLKIVEDHQGKIKVVSSPGTGTAVQVFIPVKQETN